MSGKNKVLKVAKIKQVFRLRPLLGALPMTINTYVDRHPFYMMYKIRIYTY